jgi:hypothetical protein
LTVLILVAITTNSIHLHQQHEAAVDLPAGSVLLIADDGEYLKAWTQTKIFALVIFHERFLQILLSLLLLRTIDLLFILHVLYD